MVIVFAETTTHLSSEFISCFNDEDLICMLSQLCKTVAVDCNKGTSSSFKISGQWKDLLLAHSYLHGYLVNINLINKPTKKTVADVLSNEYHSNNKQIKDNNPGKVHESNTSDCFSGSVKQESDAVTCDQNNFAPVKSQVDSSAESLDSHIALKKEETCAIDEDMGSQGKPEDDLESFEGEPCELNEPSTENLGNKLENHLESAEEEPCEIDDETESTGKLENCLESADKKLGSGCRSEKVKYAYEDEQSTEEGKKTLQHSENDQAEKYRCKKCKYVGKNLKGIQEHISRIHSSRYSCEMCDRKFEYLKDLRYHVNHMHLSTTYDCKICDKSFKHKASHYLHMKTHNENYVRSECDLCHKTFMNKYLLKQHVKIEHSGKKASYPCDACDRSFQRKDSLFLHQISAHGRRQDCVSDVCGKSFPDNRNLKVHKHLHDVTPQFKCDVCGKSFRQRSVFVRHVKIHSDHRDYVCPTCGKGFIQKQSLIRHERIHSGYKPFTCALCSRVFTDSATIRNHMILIHKSNPHNWQGDVISDLKKQSELWQGDLTSEPKSEPDFRRKADRERMKEMNEALLAKDSQEKEDNKQQESDHNMAHSSKDHFDRSIRKNYDSTSSQAEEGFCAMNQRVSGIQAKDSGSHMSTENPDNLHQQVCSAGVPCVSSHHSSHPGELKKAEFWRGDAYMEAYRSVDMWVPPGIRQGDMLQGEEMMEPKRPVEYWPPGVILDATRNSEFFRGGNIPDPRKQIEFWQGHAVGDRKSGSESMHNQLTTLQNMNFTSQS